MTHEQFAGAADENVRFAPSVRAVEVSQIVELRVFVDVVREGAMAIVRSAGIVDHEISRHRRVEIVVISARHRQPQIVAEISLEALLGKITAERHARRQPSCLSDAAGKRGGQAQQARQKISRRIHAAHQTHGLLNWGAGIAQRLGIKRTNSHARDKEWRLKMVRLASG